ncbi:hypothetical protein EMIT0111MI5_170051 [Burkholderia sp. IT-111MI5]
MLGACVVTVATAVKSQPAGWPSSLCGVVIFNRLSLCLPGASLPGPVALHGVGQNRRTGVALLHRYARIARNDNSKRRSRLPSAHRADSRWLPSRLPRPQSMPAR